MDIPIGKSKSKMLPFHYNFILSFHYKQKNFKVGFFIKYFNRRPLPIECELKWTLEWHAELEMNRIRSDIRIRAFQSP